MCEQQPRKMVVLSARVHPGETNASWIMKGIIDYLLSDSPDAKASALTTHTQTYLVQTYTQASRLQSIAYSVSYQ